MTAGKITLIVIASAVAAKLLHRVIKRLTAGGHPLFRRHHRTPPAPPVNARREHRAQAIGSVLNNAVTIFVTALAALLVLGQIGVNLGPVLASAGVLSVALGFGAQTLVSDFMSGIAMIVEDQFGVGDYVKFSTADDDGIWVEGTIEMVALRITKIRDSDGLVWYVRNGEVQKVGNKSQGDAEAV